ncbi:MAG: class I SAM-dependent methyltransferase [Patescibacteria group bacterium]
MEELYSKLAPVWNATLTATGFKRGLCNYIVKNISEQGKEDLRVLDVGCGTGLVSFTVLKNFSGSKVIATDLNKDMVKKTEELAKRGRIDANRFTVGVADVLDQDRVNLSDGSSVDLEPASFDLVVASGVLEYTPLDKAVSKLLGLTKQGGRLMVVSIKDDPVGKLWGKMYKFKPIEKEHLEKELLKCGCTSVVYKPLSFREFPTNITRTGHLAIK